MATHDELSTNAWYYGTLRSALTPSSSSSTTTDKWIAAEMACLLDRPELGVISVRRLNCVPPLRSVRGRDRRRSRPQEWVVEMHGVDDTAYETYGAQTIPVRLTFDTTLCGSVGGADGVQRRAIALGVPPGASCQPLQARVRFGGILFHPQVDAVGRPIPASFYSPSPSPHLLLTPSHVMARLRGMLSAPLEEEALDDDALLSLIADPAVRDHLRQAVAAAAAAISFEVKGGGEGGDGGSHPLAGLRHEYQASRGHLRAQQEHYMALRLNVAYEWAQYRTSRPELHVRHGKGHVHGLQEKVEDVPGGSSGGGDDNSGGGDDGGGGDNNNRGGGTANRIDARQCTRPRMRREWLHPRLVDLLPRLPTLAAALESWEAACDAALFVGQGDGVVEEEGGVPASEREVLRSCLVTEESPGAFSFDLFSPAFCDLLQGEVRDYEASELPKNRPNSMNKYGLVVNDMGLEPLMDHLLQSVLRYFATALLPPSTAHGPTLDMHHSFVVQYKVGEDRHLDMHVDDSEATLNVNLHDAFTGSGLVLCGMDPDLGRRRKHGGTYTHRRGRALLHCGDHRHGAAPLTSGSRYNLIMWGRSSAHRSSPRFEEEKRRRVARSRGVQGGSEGSEGMGWEEVGEGEEGEVPVVEGWEPDQVCLSRTHDADFAQWWKNTETHAPASLIPGTADSSGGNEGNEGVAIAAVAAEGAV